MTAAWDEPEGASAEDWTVEIDLTALATRLTIDPAALTIITTAVRNEMVRLVRSKPDLFAQWAQKPLPPAAIAPNVKRRLT
ncbi:MAG: hypothetical protein KGH65_04965 [Candidatus Micrarchaeota archaeon]|nr:hypothetical protein [Candidatus Micrarchaeota archaeon]